MSLIHLFFKKQNTQIKQMFCFSHSFFELKRLMYLFIFSLLLLVLGGRKTVEAKTKHESIFFLVFWNIFSLFCGDYKEWKSNIIVILIR